MTNDTVLHPWKVGSHAGRYIPSRWLPLLKDCYELKLRWTTAVHTHYRHLLFDIYYNWFNISMIFILLHSCVVKLWDIWYSIFGNKKNTITVGFAEYKITLYYKYCNRVTIGVFSSSLRHARTSRHGLPRHSYDALFTILGAGNILRHMRPCMTKHKLKTIVETLCGVSFFVGLVKLPIDVSALLKIIHWCHNNNKYSIVLQLDHWSKWYNVIIKTGRTLILRCEVGYRKFYV